MRLVCVVLVLHVALTATTEVANLAIGETLEVVLESVPAEGGNSFGPCATSDEGNYCVRNCGQNSVPVCAEECPAGQGGNEERVCEDCTDDAPFSDTERHRCVSHCSSGAAPFYTFQKGSAELGNDTATARSCVVCNQTKNEHGEDTPFVDHNENKCVEECPDGTVGNATHDCTSLCPNDRQTHVLYFDGMADDSTTYANCVTECGPGKVPDLNDVCGRCVGTVNETGYKTPFRQGGTHCVSKCGPGQGANVNSDCVDCAAPTPFSHQNATIHKCVAQCDAGHVGNNATSTCQQCAQDSSEPPRWLEWADRAVGTCVSFCPEGTVESNSGDCEPIVVSLEAAAADAQPAAEAAAATPPATTPDKLN